jgi:hypothetical protein
LGFGVRRRWARHTTTPSGVVMLYSPNFVSTPFCSPLGTITTLVVIDGAFPITTLICFECRMDLLGHRLA